MSSYDVVIDHIYTYNYEIYGTLNFYQLFLIKRLSYGAETVVAWSRAKNYRIYAKLLDKFHTMAIKEETNNCKILHY